MLHFPSVSDAACSHCTSSVLRGGAPQGRTLRAAQQRGCPQRDQIQHCADFAVALAAGARRCVDWASAPESQEGRPTPDPGATCHSGHHPGLGQDANRRPDPGRHPALPTFLVAPQGISLCPRGAEGWRRLLGGSRPDHLDQGTLGGPGIGAGALSGLPTGPPIPAVQGPDPRFGPRVAPACAACAAAHPLPLRLKLGAVQRVRARGAHGAARAHPKGS